MVGFLQNVDETVAELDSSSDYEESDWDSSYILAELRKKGVLTAEQYASYMKCDASSAVKKKALLRWQQNHLLKGQ